MSMGPMVYRFELAFDGQPQGIGVMRGLDDIGLPEGISLNIEADFNELPCPYISEAVSFWFTERGLRTFQYTLDYLAEHSQRLNWQVLCARIPRPDMSQVVYADEFQVALRADCMDALRPKYKEFTSANDLLKKRRKS